jgi:hypothetical protein
MRLEIFILGITIFFIYNAYHDGKYTKMLFSYKKYYQMAFFSVIGIGVYLLLKRNPVGGRQLLLHANNMVKYMPIDKSALNMIGPIFDFTEQTPNPRMLTSGQNVSWKEGNGLKNNRSVSGMKKKYIASIQNWKCGQCQKQLDYTYEVDHKIRLEHGGGNDVQNLIALCRECHGKKTVLETF